MWIMAERDGQGREALVEAILSARWPNGDRIDGVTTRTAAMIADALGDFLKAHDAEVAAGVLREAAERVRLDCLERSDQFDACFNCEHIANRLIERADESNPR